MAKFIDLTGQKFNKLTVLCKSNKRDNSGSIYWKCKCDCGNETLVITKHLKNGHTKSCGCLHIQQAKEQAKKMIKNNIIHNKSNTRLYHIYQGMINRCYKETHKFYKNYGGRGIRICDEWLKDFMSFYNWAMENGYKEDLTIDRINNNGNYEPNNCRWLTIKEQAENRRTNTLYKYKGEIKPLKLICEELNVKYTTIRKRIVNGMSLEEALNIEQQKDRK